MMNGLYLNGQIADVHIFEVDIDTCYERIRERISKVVSVPEQNKAERFLNKHDRKRHLVSRFVLRNILSSFIELPPELIKFHHYGNRKPAVKGVEFNMSHSGNLLMIALSYSQVGIDIEFINPGFEFKSVLIRSFSETEQSLIQHSENPLHRFYWFWTRKEAVLKASGEGLTEDMNQLDVAGDTVIHNGNTYLVRTFPLTDNHYVLSLASDPANVNILFRHY